MKHTPGPWQYEIRNGIRIIQAVNFHGMKVAQGLAWTVGIHDDEDEANARLITAAPEQYHALVTAPAPLDAIHWSNETTHSDWMDNYRDWWLRMRKAAIAKAEGRGGSA